MLVAIFLSAFFRAPEAWATEPRAFGVDDYFRLKRVSELALSSDGRWLAYVTETSAESAGGRELHLRSLAADGRSTTIGALSDARRIAWIPGTGMLAFLRSAEGIVQLFSYDVATGAVTQRTRSGDSVISYLFSPDGRKVAYATRAVPDPAQSLYDRFRNDESGIIVDPATTSSHDFLNPEWNALVRPPSPVLWIAGSEDRLLRVPVPGAPGGHDGTYFWASDGRAISVTFVADDIPESQLSSERTSLGIYDLESGRFEMLARGFPPDGGRPGNSFAGGEWIPRERKVLVRRVNESDPWVSGSFPDLAVVDLDDGLAAASWRPAELYPRGLRIRPTTASDILIENMVRGVHSLFVLGPDGLHRSPIVAGLEGSSTLFAFSADHGIAAFVQESLTQPPEIFIRSRDAAPRQLTSLNGDVAARIRHRAREVRWASSDGVEISGWLLEPTEAGPGPWPLVTHVHGGPAFPFPDAFAPYFDYWPYPLEAYASHGMAVFLPNYRGTHTYGRPVASPTDREPVQDIVTGIEQLIEAGVAAPARLAISGHSHGAFLGPLTMTRARIFRASSFAEGVANSIVMYELMSGDANREIHDPVVGASLYEDPERYLDESPDLHFEGVSTASLFEAGARTAAIFMLGFPKAAERFGMPNEFIVYPNTAHNITRAHLQRESAMRNLDWFDFWLNDRENPGAARQAQYVRWRRLRADWAPRRQDE